MSEKKLLSADAISGILKDLKAENTALRSRLERAEGERDYLLDRIQGRSFGLSATRLILEALGRTPTHPHYAAFEPRDTGDLGRCEEAFATAPPHLQERMRPTLDRWRAALSPTGEDNE